MSGKRFAAGLVAAIVALYAVFWLLQQLSGGSPGGPASSSYATGADGTAAWADLLVRAGHEVVRLRVTPSKAVLPRASTAVVLDPPFVLDADAKALERFVRQGGRLIVGDDEVRWLAAILPGRFELAPGKTTVRPLAPLPEVAGVAEVATDGASAWTHVGASLPILARNGDVVAVAASIGRGTVVALADDSMLQNELLGTAGDARFALDIAGPSSRPVEFFESYHGYGSSSGISAVPPRWRALIALGAVAALLYLLARGWRLGPPEREERELDPPRREYVEAMAGILLRTRSPGKALESIHEEARRRLAARAGRPLETPEAVLEAARELGLAPEEAAAVARASVEREDVLPLGRAFVRLGGEERGEERTAWRS